MVGAVGQEPVLADKHILVLEASVKPPQKLSREDPYGIRVVNVNMGSVELLKRLGVWSDITAVRAREFDHMHIWDSCANSVVLFDPTHHSSIGYIVENDLITDVLCNRVNECGNVEVQRGRRVVTLDKSSTSWRGITLDNGMEIKTKLLVGADGAQSNIRQLAGMNTIGWKYNQSAVVAKLDVSYAGDNRTAWQRFLPTGPIALLPLTDSSSSLVWSTTPQHAKQLMSLDGVHFITAVNAALCDYYPRSQWVDLLTSSLFNQILSGTPLVNDEQQPPHISGVTSGSIGSYPLALHHSVRYVQDRIVLVGDAAHTIHPLAGLGVNLGFGDVSTLTDLLRGAASMGSDVGHRSHLLQYESIRQRHNVPIMAFVDITKRIYSTSSTIPVIVRASIARLVSSVYPIKGLLTSQAEKIV
ncbi:ubiquinone biosynthesis monooxygenase COQ6, mitochondrial-like isoform X2 [Dysidea avara]|uniref:ubiquinone biosynthesis monooxygenase COQ6, mitochondrial-like isoform X2 n=1 Tax=Dysidea avara TaxID=196820 RepID=UPI00331E5AFE